MRDPVAIIDELEPDGRFAVPARFNFAEQIVYRMAERVPEAVALVAIAADGAVARWDFARVARAARALAGALAAEGLRAGDRVLILMPRVPEWQVVMTACLHLGAVPVPCVTQVTAAELDDRLQRAACAALVGDVRFADKLAALTRPPRLRVARGGLAGWLDLDALIGAGRAPPPPADMPAETPALMYFTSGSSGPPKPVMHAARGVYVRSRQPWRQIGLRPGDVIWTTSDTGWTRAASCLLFGAWANGATALMHDGALEPADRVAVLAEQGVTVFGAVATELRLILASGARRPLPRLRVTLSAGEAMTAELADGWRGFTGLPLIVGYGQSETPTATLTAADDPPLNGMIGAAMVGNRVTVLDAQGREAAPGLPGHIAFHRSDAGLMLGYWEDGRARLPLADDWYLTGDSGWRDDQGRLFFLGREDDIISSGGYRIGPTEVENALMQHPAVAECAVVASPDALRGEVVKAYVVLRHGTAGTPDLTERLQAHVKGAIAPYKYPRRIAFVDALPRTASGKLSRRLLREREYRDAAVAVSKGEP